MAQQQKPTLRIIAGRYRRRKVKPVPGRGTRPMPGRLRESLFNVLGDQVAGKVFVDLYAGSGAVGLEALSRGAEQVIFVESSRAASRVIEENLASLGAGDDGLLIHAQVKAALDRISGGIYFLGPPYPMAEEYQKTLETLGGAPPYLVIVQHATRFKLLERYGGLVRFRTIKQGSNSLSLFRAQE